MKRQSRSIPHLLNLILASATIFGSMDSWASKASAEQGLIQSNTSETVILPDAKTLENRSKTVVFIDSTIADYQQLASHIKPDTYVFILDAKRDGIKQITETLSSLTEVSSVQIISHGTEGTLYLGSTSLNPKNLNRYASQFHQWRQSLTKTADILLYGCDVARGEMGQTFVQRLGQITGADVAASDNLTGNSLLGGDWKLEYATGLINESIALQKTAMDTYSSVLKRILVTNNNDSGEGSLRAAIAEAWRTPELDVIDLTGVSGVILLNSSLEINNGNHIQFEDDGNTTISGQDRVQIMTIKQANVVISRLTFANGRAKGGDGVGGGGGGLGAGGALFIEGTATLENVTFLNNQAIGGNGGIGANGGELFSNGQTGGYGGGLNGLSGSAGGNGGIRQRGNQSGDPGNAGSGDEQVFGSGGGGGGGGAGQAPPFGCGSCGIAGMGGKGGKGGFGGGGGGGGGGGSHNTENDRTGNGGNFGEAGSFGGKGKEGNKGLTARIPRGRGASVKRSGNSGGTGGQGGGGAGLGGAVFIKSGANLTLENSTFRENSAKGGSGGNAGEGKGNHLFVMDGANSYYKGSNGNDIISPDQLNDSNDFYVKDDFVVDGLDGRDTLYVVAGIDGVTKTLKGGDDQDTFIINLKGKTKFAFNFNTQKLGDFVNAVTIEPVEDLGTSDLIFARSLIFDGISAGLGTLPVVGTVAPWIFESSRAIGEYLTDRGSSQQAIEDQRQRTQSAVSEFGTQNWGEIFQEGERDLIEIEDFQPGLDTIILPSLRNSTRGLYEYTLNLGSNGIEFNVRTNNTKIERFVLLKNNYRSFGVTDSQFLIIINDLMVKDENNRFTGTISSFKQTIVRGTNSANNEFETTYANDLVEALRGNDEVEGQFGDDIIEGGDGDDKLYGGFNLAAGEERRHPFCSSFQSNNLCYRDDGNDLLYGERGNDELYGESGHDVLDGGSGSNTLVGGIGNDRYIVDADADTIIENLNEGTDTIESSINFSLVDLSNLENLTLTGTTAINGTGNSGNNVILGNSVNNILDGGAGDDELYGDEITPVFFNGNFYRLTNSQPWQDAQAQARSWGGNLVTINSQIQQNWLVNTFGGTQRFWIGLTDEEKEGNFQWVSQGSLNCQNPTTYCNWFDGEPNNSGGDEDVVEMNLNSPGKWNDINKLVFRPGIVENKTYEWNGSLYLLSGSATWLDAQKQARSLGGNLVTINSKEEQDWLSSTFGTQERWIGLVNEVEALTEARKDDFKWVSGEPVTYENWDSVEPNNFNNTNERYVQMRPSPNSFWNDLPGTSTLTGIIEIKGSDDSLNGDSGDDSLDGGTGNDILNGSDLISLGQGEKDKLTGGAGKNRFILGDASNIRYDDRDPLTPGINDFADIRDFKVGDTIQLHGDSRNYRLVVDGSDTQIFIDKPESEPDELIGIIRNQTTLTLDGDDFVYVGQ